MYFSKHFVLQELRHTGIICMFPDTKWMQSELKAVFTVVTRVLYRGQARWRHSLLPPPDIFYFDNLVQCMLLKRALLVNRVTWYKLRHSYPIWTNCICILRTAAKKHQWKIEECMTVFCFALNFKVISNTLSAFLLPCCRVLPAKRKKIICCI